MLDSMKSVGNVFGVIGAQGVIIRLRVRLEFGVGDGRCEEAIGSYFASSKSSVYSYIPLV